MASKERPPLHLKKNPDMPPKPVPAVEAFNPSSELRRANHILNDLRQELYVAGSSTSAVEAPWKKALELHGSIIRSVQQYEGSTDAHERTALEKSIKRRIATLAEP